jgi:uncharacterized protein (DUF1499 family)
MALTDWFTRNWANTDERDPALAPLEIPLPLPAALELVQGAIRSLPRWQVESVDPGTSLVRATRRTRLWRFVDDVTVRLEVVEDRTRVHVRSKARVGIGDFRQNRRNIIQLMKAICEPRP